MKTNILKMIEQAEVEWKPLGEVFKVLRGKRLTKRDLIEYGKFSVFHGGIEPIGFYDQYNREENSAMIINVGASAGTVGYSDKKFWSSDGCFCFSHTEILSQKFLFYFLKSIENVIKSKVRKAGIPTLDNNVIEKIQIPIPPLELQKEIVKRLDILTEQEAALEAELSLRKKQYQYYRDLLLSENELAKAGFEWKSLEQISENLNPMRKPIKGGLREFGNIPYYGASGIVDYVKDYIFDDDLLLISEDGANLLARNTPIAFSVSGKCWVNNHAHVLKFKTYEERRFIEFYLNHMDLSPYISGAAQPKLNKQNLNSIKFPIPDLPTQAKIVAILDKFDRLTSSITGGLPKEIELRRKQYEYYRELLLGFENDTKI